ncbi:hypothetical protein EDE12_11223 [Methylosinus sp. sav-2]|uniref:hypothetical protein n=1 Tax=Methylosinus sp. sav-2 TaxID=2485168 RepID=UPI00047BD867|nr:hypothetical protein [Methylosinus sp. sav-2]TDX61922.1 hypothetical protein EDE12_11223 [Methylosinus sp. sav-2]
MAEAEVGAIVYRFQADTSGLKAGFAEAQTQLRSMGAGAAEAGKQAAAAGQQAGAAFEQAGQRFARASESVAKLQKDIAGVARGNPLKEIATGADSASAGFQRASGSVEKFNAGLDRVRDFAWNNTGFSGDEIDRVINPLQGLTAAIGVLPTIAVAAVGAAAAAFAMLELRAREVHIAAQQLADDLSLGGQVNAFGGATEAVGHLAEQLTRMSSVWDVVGEGAALSADEARKFGSELAKLPAVTTDIAAGFADLARSERYAFGAEGVDMVQGLVGALKQPDQALQTLISTNLSLTTAQRQAAQGALDSGNAQRQASTYFQLVTDDFVRQKSEAVLLDAAHNSLSSTTRTLADEALAAARASGDFEGALQQLALAGSSAAQKLLGAVSAIRSIRAEMAKGLSGEALSNALQNANDKLYPLHTAARAASAQFADATGQVKDLESRLGNATANLNRLKQAGEAGTKEFATGAADIAQLNDQLVKARANAAAYGMAAQKASEAIEGGASYDRAKKNIDTTHDADKDEVARHRETIAALEAQRADLERANVASTEDGVAKIREINQGLRDEEAKLAEERLKVQIARIDAEIAKEAQGSERKKQLARQKFELETQGVSPNSAEYIGKESELRSALDEEAKGGGGSHRAAASERQSAIERYLDSLRQSEALARAEVENWGKGNVERAQAVALARAKETADREGLTLSDAQRAQIEAAAGATQRYKDRLDELKQKQQEVNAVAREFGDMLASSLDQVVVQGKNLKDTLSSLLKSLESSALRGLLTGEGMFGQAFGLAGKNGAPGGLFGQAFSGLSGLFGLGGNWAAQPAQTSAPLATTPAQNGVVGAVGSILGLGGAGQSVGAMNVTAASVTVSGAAGGGIGSLLSKSGTSENGATADASAPQGGGLFDGLSARLSGLFSKLTSVFDQLFSKIGDLLSGLVNSIGGLFSGGAGGSGGGLLSGIGSLFGGMFAEGGSLPSGKWGIVGERGPEIISGPARITPMHKFAGMFADGGMIPEGKWGIAGERGVEMASDMASSGAAAARASDRGTSIKITNMRGRDTDVSAKRLSDGEISILIDHKVSGALQNYSRNILDIVQDRQNRA